MYKSCIILCIALLFCGCGSLEFKPDNPRMQALNDMLQTDADFSRYSLDKGMREAFLNYFEEDGILLEDNRMPLIGADAIDYISRINDTSFTMSWDPLGGDVSASGDMGFTYGTYKMKLPDTVLRGSYVTIWRKQTDGSWKCVLDSGNEGLGESGATMHADENGEPVDTSTEP